MSVKKQMKFG